LLRPAVVALVAATALALGGAPALGRGEAFVQFRTPSGNIGCGYGSVAGERRFLRCDILSGIRPLPPKPRDCREDWGTAISLGRTGRASLICVGDTVLDLRSRILRYGQLWRRGGFTCSSRATGLTCTNRSRHGFVLSRERSRLF
jgi:hypothetical protein